MLKRTIMSGLATIAVAAGIAMTAPVSANARNLNIELGFSSGHGTVTIGNRHHRPRYKKHRRHQVCHPGRAIHKAERRGVRNARVKRVNDRFVVVKGRKRGSKIRMAFYRDSRRCELAWVKRSRNQHRHYGYRY